MMFLANMLTAAKKPKTKHNYVKKLSSL